MIKIIVDIEEGKTAVFKYNGSEVELPPETMTVQFIKQLEYAFFNIVKILEVYMGTELAKFNQNNGDKCE